MHNVMKILTIAVLASLCISACKCKQKSSKQNPTVIPIPAAAQTPVAETPPAFSEGRLWVNSMISRYPELTWLAHDVNNTEEGLATAENLYSEQLYGRKSLEFDRTLLSLQCLQRILDGSEKAYLELTAAQSENSRLSKESFNTLHAQGLHLLNSNDQNISPSEMQQALETALVLKHALKSGRARHYFMRFGAHAADPIEFYQQVLEILKKNPRLFHSFSRLSPSAKQLLIQASSLIQSGHWTQEAGLSFFTQLKQSNVLVTDPTVFSFDLFVHACDVAGHLGHLNNTSSLAYTELAHRNLQAVVKACDVLADPTKTESDAYEVYLAESMR